MRVIGGTAKGRPLKTVPGDKTRPILDRVKTALFDILRPQLDGSAFLDLFSGTGGVGIEALSQGASRAVFLDISRKAIDVIRDNVRATGFREKATVHHQDAFLYLKNTDHVFDIIYIAPPQYKAMWIKALHQIAERPEVARENGMLIVQIDPKEYEQVSLTDFEETGQRKYGSTLLVFYKKRSRGEG